MELVETKTLKWDVVLRKFLVERQGDNASYVRPERKYIHMDIIMPGYESEETLESAWIFVDSSGSLNTHELNVFLTHVQSITKQFNCSVNICYWNTKVSDVYTDMKAKDILKSQPSESGGTDINCVYRYLEQNKIKPSVIMIMTDGYFGRVEQRYETKKLKRKTIFVLTKDGVDKKTVAKYGKVTKL